MRGLRGVGEYEGSTSGLGGHRAWGEEAFQPVLWSLVCRGKGPPRRTLWDGYPEGSASHTG